MLKTAIFTNFGTNFLTYPHNRVSDFLQHVFNEILAEYTSFVGTRESCIELIRNLDTDQIFEVMFWFHFVT